MEFFDRKEEVIDIQLTQYGKHLLSIGKFKPTQYAFYDSDVTYDNTYASGSEQQNSAESRIKETPRLKTQYVYSGIETQIRKLHAMVKEGAMLGDSDPFQPGVQFGNLWSIPEHMTTYKAKMVDLLHQPAAEKNYSLTLPLGQSSITSEYYPAWDIDFLHGSASVDTIGNSFTEVITGTNFKNIKIPQGEVELRYKTYITYVDDYGDILYNYLEEPVSPEEEFLFPEVYRDNTTIQVQPDYLLLDILEENVDFETENFYVEVFKIDSGGNEEQLMFMDEHVKEKTEQHVEWWFDVQIDDEIDPFIYCRSRKEEKRKNIFADQFQLFKCSEIEEQPEIENIYEVVLTEDDFEEPC